MTSRDGKILPRSGPYGWGATALYLNPSEVWNLKWEFDYLKSQWWFSWWPGTVITIIAYFLERTINLVIGLAWQLATLVIQGVGNALDWAAPTWRGVYIGWTWGWQMGLGVPPWYFTNWGLTGAGDGDQWWAGYWLGWAWWVFPQGPGWRHSP